MELSKISQAIAEYAMRAMQAFALMIVYLANRFSFFELILALACLGGVLLAVVKSTAMVTMDETDREIADLEVEMAKLDSLVADMELERESAGVGTEEPPIKRQSATVGGEPSILRQAATVGGLRKRDKKSPADK